jgi:hypothetical protein
MCRDPLVVIGKDGEARRSCADEESPRDPQTRQFFGVLRHDANDHVLVRDDVAGHLATCDDAVEANMAGYLTSPAPG